MATEIFYTAVKSVALLPLVLAIGCGVDDPDTHRMSMHAFALKACSGTVGDAFAEIQEVEYTVQMPVSASGVLPAPFKKRQALGGSPTTLFDVPAGDGQTVTMVGYSGPTPTWFARRSGFSVKAGEDNPLQVTLARYGGFSCPKTDAEYTQRVFPTVTSLGSGKYFIAGGLTSGGTTGAITFSGGGDGSRKAFIYDAWTGTMTKVATLMIQGRGAHAAVLVRGTDKNRVVLFGGTQKLTFNAQNANKFGWTFDANDALGTVEVFQWDAAGDPKTGQFLSATTMPPVGKSKLKRVFPTANVISTDGFTLVCGGGAWGGANNSDWQSCDVWDASKDKWIQDSLGVESNNVMNIYRAGLATAVLQTGAVTRLLVYGGGQQGNVAEIYTSSTTQRDGVGGTFSLVDAGDAPHAFFHTLTPLGGGKFIMLGGVNYEGAAFAPPSADNAWLLTVTEQGGTTQVASERIGGLSVGRYFHVAAAPAGNKFVVLGGFTGTDLTPTDDTRFYKEGTGLIPSTDTAGKFLARGGMGFSLLDNDTILISGGVQGANDLSSGSDAGALEVYAPSNLVVQ